MKTYKIIRFYRKSSRQKVIRRGLSLAEAQAHCSDPSSKKDGVWFDGFAQE
jgi:hypothetical protein